MDDIVFAGNRALYLILVMSAGPIAVATFVGLLVGLFQTVTQLQEQTLPFGVKLLCVSICFFLMSGWYGEKLYSFGIKKEVQKLSLNAESAIKKFFLSN